jgi:hypothetical protein
MRMNRFSIALIAMHAMCGTTLLAQANEESFQESIPLQISQALEHSPISKTHRVTSRVNPYYFHGDFDGDGRTDIAVWVEEISSNKVGIAILNGKSNNLLVLGAGAPYDSASKSKADSDDLKWADIWFLIIRSSTTGHRDSSVPKGAKGDVLHLIHSGSSGGFLYWNGKRYVWQPSGC